MAEKVSTEAFRSVFKVISKDAVHWFPGHMGRGLKQMQHKLRSVDCVIEVHDARIPLSGMNPNFKYTVSGVKPHILVLNKLDLIEKKLVSRIKDRVQADYPNVIFTNCKDHNCQGVKGLFPMVQKLIRDSNRYNRSGEEDNCIMIIGVPNVGKSSLINALRAKHLHKGGATQVGSLPGITRSVLHKIKMCQDPLVYMLDTPGILSPHIENTEVGLKLALCNTIQDHLVGATVMADYLLYWLNKNEQFHYVKVFKLEEATDNILEVLAQISISNKKMLKMKNNNNEYVLKPDFEWAALVMLKAFRTAQLGKICLDIDVL